MAITFLRRRSPAAPSEPDDGIEGMEIGADGARDIFSCPTCARPLAVGTSRCRGCGTVFLAGVPARRASLFLAIGAVVGLVVGATFATVASGVTRGGPSTAAGVVGGPDATASPQVMVAAPNAAANALRLTIAVDDRLSASEVRLRSLLSGSFDTLAVAGMLRSMAADAAWGVDVVGRLADWPAAADLQPRLRDLYRKIVATASDGLSKTITSPTAYRTAAKRMLAHAAAISALRAESVALAAAYGISLPQP